MLEVMADELTPAQQVMLEKAAKRAAQHYKLGPCPVDERVHEFDGEVDTYAASTKRGCEGESVGEDGVYYQKCGGGRRIVRKKIGGG